MTMGKWIAVLVCAGLLYLLSPILAPFFLGALLAYLADPFVSVLARLHVPRALGVVIVFIVMILLLLLLLLFFIPLIQYQIIILVNKVPAIIDWIQTEILPWINAHFDVQAKLSLDSIKAKLAANSDKVKDMVSFLVRNVTQSTFAVITFLTNLLLVPVVTFYLLRDWPKVKASVVGLLPADKRERLVRLATECDEVVAAFFKGQLLVMLGLAIIYSAGLWLVGLPVALFVGLLSGLAAIVPYLGFLVGIITASIAMYLETHQISSMALVWLVYMLGQACESMVLTPLLVGDRIGLHPVAVIFAVMAGGILFGFIGVLIALPVSAMILVLLKHLFKKESEACAKGEESAASA